MTLSVGEGTLTAPPATAAQPSSAATARRRWSITGTIAQLNALLNTDGTSTMLYNDNTDTPGASTTLTLSINDNGNTGTGGADRRTPSATIDITAVNDAPVLSQTSNTVGYTENGAPLQLLPTEIASDPDLPANFNGGFVQVALTNSVAGDRLGLLSGSTFTVDGLGNVMDGATTIGTVSAGGFGTTAVTISLGANATAGEVSGLLKALSYDSTSDDPTARDPHRDRHLRRRRQHRHRRRQDRHRDGHHQRHAGQRCAGGKRPGGDPDGGSEP